MNDPSQDELFIQAPGSPVRLSEEITLVGWQQEAVDSWITGDAEGPYRGTLEIFTGGGKTLIALAAFCRVSAIDPTTKLAVVVPTEALARQWVATIIHETNLEKDEVGLLGAGSRSTFNGKRAIVAVLNSAARKLPDMAREVSSLMLVLDECHRAGAATFSKVLRTPAKYRLGLSATPARDELDEAGLPLSYDRQIVGRKIGSVVFRFGLREAREIGWLPSYTVHHHGVRLTAEERRDYERVSRKVTDAADRLTSAGFPTSQAWSLASRGGDAGPLAQAYIGSLAARKDFLYRASERNRVAARLVKQSLQRETPPRILLFHERVTEVEALFAQLMLSLPSTPIGIEHSELPAAARRHALADFRSGKSNVLVSVKSLVEGIDVPDADIGISVASSSSVRQRIQTLGRVLRRRFDGGVKNAEMHVLYAHDTVDQSIYGKEDWSDLTGSDANRYWLWPLDSDENPEEQAEPPLKPRPSEEAEWQRFARTIPSEPALWTGELPNYEFSVDTRGNVTTGEGAVVDNPQGVSSMVERVRGRPGGKFRVTPLYNLVIVFGESEGRMQPFLAGRLAEPFRLREETAEAEKPFDATLLEAGSIYPGPTDRTKGTFKLRQKRGGVIEKRLGHLSQFAGTSSNANPLDLNGQRVLDAWKSLGEHGFTFYVNRLDHAWYRADGEPKFLADVPGGFSWPDPEPEVPEAEATPTSIEVSE